MDSQSSSQLQDAIALSAEPAWRRWGMIIVPIAAWLVCVLSYWDRGFISTVTRYSDAAAYVECAESIAQGRGFVHTRGFYALELPLWEPINLWPPGYPLLFAPLVKLGVPGYYAGVAINALASAFFLVLLGRLARRWLPFVPALLITTAFAVSKQFIELSTACLSDAPYLLLTTVSMISLGYGVEESSRTSLYGGRTARWCAIAGASAGVAWTVRNVGVSLGVASVFAFLSFFLFMPFWSVVRRGLAWSAGFMLAAGWLIVRNFIVFHKFNPYSMGPSERHWWLNVIDAFCTVVTNIAGKINGKTSLHNQAVAVGIIAFLTLIAVSAAIVWFVLAMQAQPTNNEATRQVSCVGRVLRDHFSQWFPAAYAATYLAVVIGSRSVYRWGELINARHLLQVDWILWLAAGAWIIAAARAIRIPKALAIGLACLVPAATVVCQIRFNVEVVAQFKDDRSAPITPAKAHQIAALVGPNELVLTDLHTPLRMFAHLFARQLPQPREGEPPITDDDIRRSTDDGMLWGLVLVDPDEAIAGTYGPTIQRLAQNPDSSPGFERVPEIEGILVMRWIGLPKTPPEKN